MPRITLPNGITIEGDDVLEFKDDVVVLKPQAEWYLKKDMHDTSPEAQHRLTTICVIGATQMRLHHNLNADRGEVIAYSGRGYTATCSRPAFSVAGMVEGQEFFVAFMAKN